MKINNIVLCFESSPIVQQMSIKFQKLKLLKRNKTVISVNQKYIIF
jgi:hypothetical protein